MATTPPPLTPFGGTAPQRGDKTTFSARFDAFITWFIACVAQFVAIAANVYANAQEAFTSAGTATSAAAAALSTANATLWISGTTYQQYANVIGPTDGVTYRRITAAGSGTTDPKSDIANYVALSSSPAFYLKVSDKKPNSTSGGSANGSMNVRTLNTIDWNDISGASLASNQVTLPAGTYEVFGRAPLYGTAQAHQLVLQNVTDTTPTVVGAPAYTTASTQSDSILFGKFSISGTKVFQLNHYNGASGATANGLGIAFGLGVTGEFAAIYFKKVA